MFRDNIIAKHVKPMKDERSANKEFLERLGQEWVTMSLQYVGGHLG